MVKQIIDERAIESVQNGCPVIKLLVWHCGVKIDYGVIAFPKENPDVGTFALVKNIYVCPVAS